MAALSAFCKHASDIHPGTARGRSLGMAGAWGVLFLLSSIRPGSTPQPCRCCLFFLPCAHGVLFHDPRTPPGPQPPAVRGPAGGWGLGYRWAPGPQPPAASGPQPPALPGPQHAIQKCQMCGTNFLLMHGEYSLGAWKKAMTTSAWLGTTPWAHGRQQRQHTPSLVACFLSCLHAERVMSRATHVDRSRFTQPRQPASLFSPKPWRHGGTSSEAYSLDDWGFATMANHPNREARAAAPGAT